MKNFFLFILLFSFFITIAQTQTEKYNSLLKRYDVFDSNGNMIAYIVYNNSIAQWEYTKVNNSNSSSSIDLNYELVNKTLESKVAKFNKRMVYTEMLMDDTNQKLIKEFGKEGLCDFAHLALERFKSITDSSGKLNIYDDEIFRKYKSILLNSYNEVANSYDKKNQYSANSKKVSTSKNAKLLYSGAKFRAQPNVNSEVVYETDKFEDVFVLQNCKNSIWLKVRINNSTGYISKKWVEGY